MNETHKSQVTKEVSRQRKVISCELRDTVKIAQNVGRKFQSSANVADRL